MTIWKFKACPRCGGDIYIERDEHNTYYLACLLCAYKREFNSQGELMTPLKDRAFSKERGY